ncbi:MAG: hypothetical protein KGP28_06305 [Bdellovibrionales bacterium]|nr:hypothetical protein [Bdellovibrionales bacterium]
MRWLLPIGAGLLGIWVGLNSSIRTPKPEQASVVWHQAPSPVGHAGSVATASASNEPKGLPYDASSGEMRTQLAIARNRLKVLQKERRALEEDLRKDSTEELVKKRSELERLQLKLKSRSGIGDRENEIEGGSKEEAWSDGRARELEAKKRNPSGEVESALASLRREHRTLISRRDQVKSGLGASSSN